MMRLSQLRPPRSKKSLLVMSAAAALLVIGVGAYVAWSKQVWAEYTPAYTQRHQGVHADIKSIAALSVSNTKEQAALLARLESMSNRIDSEQKSLCKVNVWVVWQQQFISSYNDAQTACQKETADIVAFQKRLNLVIAFIKDDQALAEIMSTVTPSGELADSEWEKQVAAWDGVIAAATKLSVSDTFKPTQQRAVEKMSIVKQAWAELILAHQQKDKVKYLAAHSSLGASYDGLSVVSEESNKGMRSLTDILNDAYIKAFN